MTDEHLGIDSHVIRQLGYQLITDAEQALLELVKNSYDADSTWTKVTIDTDHMSVYGQGSVTVEDNGIGMDEDGIRKGWLRVSFSLKRPEAGEIQKRKTDKGRTPLGDKGLGRLSTMRLGRCVEIDTYSKKMKDGGRRVTVDWDRFIPGTTVDKIVIPMTIINAPPKSGQGTTLTVYGLESIEYWKGKDRRDQLCSRFSRLLSPFQQFEGFKIVLVIDGEKVDLEHIDAELRDSSTSRLFARWDDSSLHCRVLIKLTIFRTQQNSEDVFGQYFAADGGRKLLDHLVSLPALRDYAPSQPKARQWLLEGQRTIPLQTIIAATKNANQSMGAPGPFTAEMDTFSLGPGAEANESIFSQFQEYKDYVKRHAGVRVYRDGFEIRMPDDWLGLGKSQTSGGSWYGPRPSNTVGFVAITGEQNPALTEKSDREGFVDTPAYRLFRACLDQFVAFANGFLELVRRGALGYIAMRRAEDAKLPPRDWKPTDAVKQLSTLAAAARSRREALAQTEIERKRRVNEVKTAVADISKAHALPSAIQQKLDKALRDIDRLLLEWEAKRAEIDSTIASVAEEDALARAILDRFEHLKSQSEEVYEKVAIGLVAQAIAHDMNSLLEDLSARTTRAMRQAGSSPPTYLLTYTQSVRSVANALRKQVAFLEPMLRRGRENKQLIRISSFMTDFAGLRRERLAESGIAIAINVTDDFSVKMNQGRLLQVLENLTRNSEYWLRSAKPRNARILITVSSPVLSIEDNGPGVRAAIEDTIFDMFVTDKPRREGVGLGLFICRALLEAEDCSIDLDDERNVAGRRYRFNVNMSGIRS